ncbi:PTS lactose/cellobiose transporter subunit IIA [Loigolactobacillus binensis]|uniref:PTS lactose/cellobiose transporter subunit IIA n=1 Tax=Loigolactobacillus binensis TaxID=2559922 RepID=A0ABW3EB86_9LACO|nr:PTS lactose/cellobiose transporter subunit IIA [Loigolactobacillus binensis]
MAETKKQDLKAIMGLIVNGGNAKSAAFAAINAAKLGDFTTASTKLKEADRYLVVAHNLQTDLLAAEANGEHMQVTLLAVHGQDQIMNAIAFRDLAGEIVVLYQRLVH